MKLLLINVALNWGSTGKIVEGIGRLAVSQGWDVTVAHGARYQNPSALKSLQVTSRAGEWLHYAESALFDGQGLGSRHATRRLLAHLDEMRPDMVHIHNIHGCFINYPRLFGYLREREIPVVWTLHDCWAMTGHCVYFERTHCEKWKTQCMCCPQKRNFPTNYGPDRSRRNYRLKKSLFSTMDKMVLTTVSSWLKGVAGDSFLGGLPVRVIPNGIDTAVFKPTEGTLRERLGLQGKKMLLGVATGFGERKGVHDYSALAEMLPPEYRIVLVGVSRRDRQVLPDKITVIDRAEGAAELAEYYTAADVLLSLSYEETFGMTIVEAMACGTPAVVYDNTAQPEIVTPETGKVVATGDVDGVRNAVEAVCAKGKEYYTHGCRERAMRYDEKKSYQKYIDLYVQTC